jgi:hypothetical protein
MGPFRLAGWLACLPDTVLIVLNNPLTTAFDKGVQNVLNLQYHQSSTMEGRSDKLANRDMNGVEDESMNMDGIVMKSAREGVRKEEDEERAT